MQAVEMRGITKRFGALVANDHVNFTLRQGEIHALLGENGAGKSTLMRILYGLYHADEGEIWVNGQQESIRSPRDAIALGVGMVTQHFALAAPLTVTENVILGEKGGVALNMADADRRVRAAAGHYGIDIEPTARIKELSVGQRQRVEILKALYHNARILILDEPTAVLTPQEVDQLFGNLRLLQQEGLSVIFISHKLHEVLTITDRITVLRGGRVVASIHTQEANRGSLAQMMVGRETLSAARTAADAPGEVVLSIRDVSALDNKGLPALKQVSLDVRAGEILGIAGVSGNGQVELAQVLDGTRQITSGQVLMKGHDLTNATPAQVMATGIGRIPEDRHASVVGEMSVAQNMALEHLNEFTRNGVLDHGRLRSHARGLISTYQIKARPEDRIRTLSGGNIQKVILARVLERNPQAIVVAQPTRGLDIGATEYVRHKLIEQRRKGAAILLISEDLDELFELADRIAVIYEGQIVDVLPIAAAAPEHLGLLMAGAGFET